MRNWFFALLTLAFSLWGRNATACESYEHYTGDSCVLLPFQGRRGFWFELSLADHLRYTHVVAPLLLKEVDALNEVVVSEENRYVLAQRLDIERQIVISNQTKTIEIMVDENQSLKADAARWWHRPVPVVLVTIGTVLVLGYVVKRELL
jgi:hypothetical protein